MPRLRLLGPGDYRSMPWRNGRGTTLELLREDDADGLLWRLSAADVVAAGAFSRFPGMDRILMLVEGAGFDLRFGAVAASVVVELLVPVRFSGDWETRAENVHGRSRDLNVMVARDRIRADLSVHCAPFDAALACRSLFLVMRGAWSLRVGGTTHSVAVDNMLAVWDGSPAHVSGQGDGLLARIDLHVIPIG